EDNKRGGLATHPGRDTRAPPHHAGWSAERENSAESADHRQDSDGRLSYREAHFRKPARDLCHSLGVRARRRNQEAPWNSRPKRSLHQWKEPLSGTLPEAGAAWLCRNLVGSRGARRTQPVLGCEERKEPIQLDLCRTCRAG